MKIQEEAYEVLYEIYNQYRQKYRENSYDSRQMCLMWSTNNPPDEVEGTEPFIDIEKAFEIHISDDDAFALYDMDLEDAVIRLLELQANE